MLQLLPKNNYKLCYKQHQASRTSVNRTFNQVPNNFTRLYSEPADMIEFLYMCIVSAACLESNTVDCIPQANVVLQLHTILHNDSLTC